MSDEFSDYGEPEHTVESLFEVPSFPKAGRKERNYNADAVDDYLNNLIPACKELKEALDSANQAYSEKSKNYDKLSEAYNDLSLHVESGGTYNPADSNAHVKENVELDHGEWSEGISQTKKRERELEDEVEQLKAALEKEQAKNKTLQARPTSLPVRRQESVIETDEESLWGAEESDALEAPVAAFEPVPAESPAVTPEEAPRAVSEAPRVAPGPDYDFSSDTEHASAIVAHAARVSMASIEEARAEAQSIKAEAVREAEAMKTAETEKVNRAQEMFEEVIQSLNGVYAIHMEEAQNIYSYLESHKGEETQDEPVNEEIDLEELGIN